MVIVAILFSSRAGAELGKEKWKVCRVNKFKGLLTSWRRHFEVERLN
jgi:hypothetical protein